jgi:hypothetical protein
MEKSARTQIQNKNQDNFSLGLFNSVFQCIKCRKYNIIHFNENITLYPKTQNCMFCSNPNYIRKK